MAFCRECGKKVEQNWVTCPFCSAIIVQTNIENLHVATTNQEPKDPNERITLKTLIICLLFISGTAGLLYLSGYFNESIEGQWYLGEQKIWRFDSDGYLYADENELYRWSVEDDYLFLTSSEESTRYRYNISDGWLFISEEQDSTNSTYQDSTECFALNRNPMKSDEWLKAVDNLNIPEWCGVLDW